MRIRCLLFVGLLLASLPGMADEDSDALNARGAKALETFDQQVKTLRGSFLQIVIGGDGNTKERAEGTMQLRRPGQFLWVYEQPYEQRIVADGKNLWLYEADMEHASVRSQQEALGDSPAEILSGGSNVMEAFDYQGSFLREDVLWVQLAANKPSGDFRVIRLAFRDDLLHGMELGDNLNQVTRIFFHDVQINVPVDAKAFEFQPPEGTDVVGEPAGDISTEEALEVSPEVVSGFG